MAEALVPECLLLREKKAEDSKLAGVEEALSALKKTD
jgi:hypothetical protein